MNDLDRFMDLALADSDTRPVKWLVVNEKLPARGVAGVSGETRARWTAEEEAWLAENFHVLGSEECARVLGRSTNAIHVRVVRTGVITPRKSPDYVTGNIIAKILGVDSHYPPCWIDRGILKGERMPYPSDVVKRRVRILDFKLWLIRPESWVYFRVERMQEGVYKRLVLLAQERWADEWLNFRQAADYLGTNPSNFRHYALRHRLPAIRAEGLGRERRQVWAFWFIPRSVVERIRWKRSGENGVEYTPAQDAFLVKARDEWGKGWEDIRRLMRTKVTAMSLLSRYRKVKVRK